MHGITPKFESLEGTHNVASVFEMRQLADLVASNLAAGDILLLSGDLGSGKTTFVQSLAGVLGAEELVTSPTFTLAAEYEIPNNHIVNQLVHIDLYRLEQVRGEDLAYINELIRMAEGLRRVVVIEWAERLDTELLNAWKLSFELGEQGTQRIVQISH